MVFSETKSPGDVISSSDYNDLIVDLFGHSSRHAASGTDSLPADSISSSMLQTDSVGLDAFDESLDYSFTANVNFKSGAKFSAPLDLDGNQLQDAGHEVEPNVTSNFTVTDNEVVLVDTSSNAVTVTLGSVDVYEGSIVKVVDKAGNASTNNITVNTGGSETINGETSVVINNNFEALTFQSDGSNWVIVGRMEGGSVV